jgi:serine/threonine-protein kinase
MSTRQPDFVPAPAPARPTRLGKYTLTGVLGEGAMGTVYKGVDPLIQRPVAVKAIRKHLFEPTSTDLSVELRFRNEAQAAGRLSHPGIVAVYEYGEDNGDAFIAMEYVHGASLGRYMAQHRRMPEPDLLCVMVQLLDALHYAHEQGVWHRDIKPGNLIITRDGRLKVADFGIARIESTALTQVQQTLLIGSPGYIAPERYTGESPPDRRVDLFSCGALLYHLLTGEAPFSGSDSEVMYKVLHQQPTPPSQTSANPSPPRCYDEIVAKALAKRPQDRYASAQEFRDALVAAAVHPVSAALSPGVVESIRSIVAALDRVPERTPERPTPASPVPAPSGARKATLPSLPEGWDPALLAQIESLLTEHLGPMAKVLVRRTAKECTDVAVLVDRLADEGLPEEDRKLFLARTAKLTAAARRPPPAPLPPAASARIGTGETTALLPVLTVTPLRPETIAKAQVVLAAHIGPIAKFIVKKAASVATQREQFYNVLADMAGDGVDREQLLAELAKIH